MLFTGEELKEIYAFDKAMRAAMDGRRLFSTCEGLLGVGPRSMFDEGESGYEIYILKGAKVPYILRKLENGTYRLVGEAYVHGIMHGEVLRNYGSDWRQYQRIKLA